MKEATLKKWQVVFWQGDPGDSMYYIRWGSVGVYTGYGTAKQKKLAELYQGDYFGEMGLIDQESRSATVVVLESGTKLYQIGEDDFEEFLIENPGKVYSIIQQMSHNLRRTTKDYLDLCKQVSNMVGTETKEVDESSDYNFAQNPELVSVHDNQQSSDQADNA